MAKAQVKLKIARGLRAGAVISGVGTASYLCAMEVLRLGPICASCNPSSSEGIGRYLPVLGLGAWVAQIVLIGALRKSCAAERAFSGLVATIACALTGYRWATSEFCIVCAIHTVAWLVNCTGALLGGSIKLGSTLFVIGACLGVGSALLTPVELGGADSGVVKLRDVKIESLRAASVAICSGDDRKEQVSALVDLNCDHCRAWVQRVLGSKKEPKRSANLIWSRIGTSLSDSTGRLLDNNGLADSVAGSSEALRAFLRSGCSIVPEGKEPNGARAMAAKKLFKELELTSTPAFCVEKGLEMQGISGFDAFELIFR